MIAPKDVEVIARVYRIRRLLARHEVAAESTFQILRGIGVTQQEVLEISESEDRRRKDLLSQIFQLEREVSK